MGWLKYLRWRLKGSPYRKAKLSLTEQMEKCPHTVHGRWTPQGVERWLISKGFELNETLERAESSNSYHIIFRERVYLKSEKR